MALNCGGSCLKVVLIIFNIIFFLTGAVILGVGIWLLVDPNVKEMIGILPDSSDPLWKGSTILLIVIGAATFIVGFFGCCGACRESPCMLATYGSLLIVILLGEIVGGVLAAVFRNDLDDELLKGMQDQIPMVTKIQEDASSTSKAWHLLQFQLECCGVESYMDYRTNTNFEGDQKVPASCCVLESGDDESPVPKDAAKCQAEAMKDSDADSEYIYTTGCHDSLTEWFKGKATILIGVAIGIAILQILGITFAFCLRRQINEGEKY